eukprot:scaffold117968_cov57-Phaeocystis_antarctica.AAC.2
MPAVVYVHTPATALLVGRLLLPEQCPLGGVAPAGEQRLRPPRIELRAECREVQSGRPLALAVAAALYADAVGPERRRRSLRSVQSSPGPKARVPGGRGSKQQR